MFREKKSFATLIGRALSRPGYPPASSPEMTQTEKTTTSRQLGKHVGELLAKAQNNPIPPEKLESIDAWEK